MLGACGAALRRRSELLLIYAFYHNLSDDERSFSLWHTNLKPVANRATLQRIEGDPLDVPRWRGRGDLKHEGGSTCRGCRSIALCEALSGQCAARFRAVPIADRERRRDESHRIAVRRRVGRAAVYVCVRAVRPACQLTSQITRIPTPRRVRTRHAPGSSRAGGQRWQRQRRAQARSAPDRHRCSPPVGGPHPGPNTISTP